MDYAFWGARGKEMPGRKIIYIRNVVRWNDDDVVALKGARVRIFKINIKDLLPWMLSTCEFA